MPCIRSVAVNYDCDQASTVTITLVVDRQNVTLGAEAPADS
jgi:hypothetical protein